MSLGDDEVLEPKVNAETTRGLCQRQAKTCIRVSRPDLKEVKGLCGEMEDQSVLGVVVLEQYFLREGLVHFFIHANSLQKLALALSETGRVWGEKRKSHVRL